MKKSNFLNLQEKLNNINADKFTNVVSYFPANKITFTTSQKGSIKMLVGGYPFYKEKTTCSSISWSCAHRKKFKCQARVKQNHQAGKFVVIKSHNH